MYKDSTYVMINSAYTIHIAKGQDRARVKLGGAREKGAYKIHSQELSVQKRRLFVKEF